MSLLAVDALRARHKSAELASSAANSEVDLYVDTREAGRRIGLSEKTLRTYRCEKRGPPCLKLGAGPRGRILYRVSDLQAWFKASARVLVAG